ncbi:MAG: hypothetical protein WD489_01010 [Rhodovibrionaceae bacterium]
MNTEFYFFVVLALSLGVAVYWIKGADAVWKSLESSFDLIVVIGPLVVGSVVFAGYAETLLPKNLVARWLGGEAGFTGICIATLAGILTPGGPFASFGVLIGLARTGASFVSCVTYLTAWSVLGLHRLFVWEIPLLGLDLALLRFTCSLPLPFIAGLLSHLLIQRLGYSPRTQP